MNSDILYDYLIKNKWIFNFEESVNYKNKKILLEVLKYNYSDNTKFILKKIDVNECWEIAEFYIDGFYVKVLPACFQEYRLDLKGVLIKLYYRFGECFSWHEKFNDIKNSVFNSLNKEDIYKKEFPEFKIVKERFIKWRNNKES